MNRLLYAFLLFFIYSVMGWVVESIFVSFRKKKFINRGFLIGPYCPIYGFGSLIMVFYISQYKENIFTVFILSLVVCCVLEYITSYLMEKIYKARWWDYSDRAFNLNGRVCGLNALLFGFGGIFIVYIAQVIIDKIFLYINDNILILITLIFFIIYVLDTIISCKTVKKLRENVSNIKLRQKDSTQEIKRLVQETLTKSNKKREAFLEGRIIDSFPGIDLREFRKIRDNIKKEGKKLFKRKKK